eukprot:NODE_9525_length_366_cov_13.435331_g8619_i0.p3 GENE.NODE_9525_length_366_cov_13.435331_g8619_i0~~NODE_9525_length_366_cov_13.435331_g8619_i0.p3  ORF type:complete len:68 (+),score=10.79 NODE_9525_length_366_cov_13.435331_g8619_i0:33-236(+)
MGADRAYFEEVLASGIGQEYLTQKIYGEAWGHLASGAKSIVVPYEAARFLGASNILHLHQGDRTGPQ